MRAPDATRRAADPAARDDPQSRCSEGLSLSSLQASLRGRSRGNCHPGELGAALRRFGFVLPSVRIDKARRTLLDA